ncbi:MAG: transglutaminase family protein [Desulfuromonadales bacterium]|nr:transglutaminase family protein [Desulfuromonadales bacterium]
MNFHVTHITRYSYSQPVALCRNVACLLPRDTPWQRCLASELQIEPAPDDFRERRDSFGNRLHHFAIQNPHDKQIVTAISDVEVLPSPDQFTAANQLSWDTLRKQLEGFRTAQIFEALPFLYDSPLAQRSQQLESYAKPSFPEGRPLGDAVLELMQRIHGDFKYDPGVTTITTPLTEVMETRRGVCQDFAHLGVACLRSMGLAARYVSGYIETLPPPGQKRLVGADASHAWFSVYAGDAGWLDFDPTNNQLRAEQHITVAWGRDFADVSPVRGIALGGGKHRVVVSVDVARNSDNQVKDPSSG